MDLSYLILSEIVSRINKRNMQINMLESYVSYVVAHTDQVSDTFLHLGNEFTMAAENIPNLHHLYSAMEKVTDTVQYFYNNIVQSSNRFTELKVCTP